RTPVAYVVVIAALPGSRAPLVQPSSRSVDRVGMAMSAAELRSRPLKLGMSQQWLAAELGVTATTIARWERGERPVSNAVLVRLALDHLAGQASRASRGSYPAPATAL